ncbi:MAG: DNA polymerase Y family protein [Candidatus Sumerlaeaceae bacterium]
MDQLILHTDVDCFAVSVERARNPSLLERAIIIGVEAGGRGLVASASYEARRLGARGGMPLSIARRRFPQAVFLPQDRLAYEAASHRLFELLRNKAPVVEACSMDDFYLDVTGCEALFGGDLLRWAQQVGRQVRGELGLPLSMGIAGNKMVARIATALAKPSQMIRVTAGAEAEFLSPVSVHLLPGAGGAAYERLQGFGVRTIGELAAMGEECLALLFGKAGTELWRRARGEYHEPVKATALHRNLTQTQVLERDTADTRLLEAVAVRLAQRIAWGLRRNQLTATRASLELTYSDGAMATHSLQLNTPTDSERELIVAARKALTASFQRRVRVRALRLKVWFIPRDAGQFDFLHEMERRSVRGLFQAIDEVRSRHGFGAMVSASAIN